MTDAADLLAVVRTALRDELKIPLTTSSVISDEDQRSDVGALGGPSLSVRMGKYLDRLTVQTMPFASGLSSYRWECRRFHFGHKASGVLDERGQDTWRGSLCHRLLYLTVVQHRSVPRAADILGIDVDRARRHLYGKLDKDGVARGGALKWVADHADGVRAKRSERAALDVFTPSRLSRAICDALQREVRDFDLEQRIWEAFRHRDPTLPPWDVEWGRRQARLLNHKANCDRCKEDRAA